MRLEEYGIPVGRGTPGPLNAITDVPGVRVGHTTLIEGESVRTGVTAIRPHEGSVFRDQVPAGIAVLNGAGEITGRAQVDEYGLLETPILLTSTHAVGTAHRATIDWLAAQEALTDDFVIPVVAETYDGFLNDALAPSLRPEHVHAALDGATAGLFARGNVGGGTGMGLFHFKGGIGTASRVVEVCGEAFTVGVLVQGNYGSREQFLLAGVPVGLEITDLMPVRPTPVKEGEVGSVVVIVATDAPLSDRQLQRVARRAMLGIGRTGGIGGHTSGDLMLAFSNAPEVRVRRRPLPGSGQTVPLRLDTPRLHDAWIDPIFEATIEATQAAVYDAMFAATTLSGRRGHQLHAFPQERLGQWFSAAR